MIHRKDNTNKMDKKQEENNNSDILFNVTNVDKTTNATRGQRRMISTLLTEMTID